MLLVAPVLVHSRSCGNSAAALQRCLQHDFYAVAVIIFSSKKTHAHGVAHARVGPLT